MVSLRVDETDDRVGDVLARPERRNAIDQDMVDELHRVCALLERDPRVLVLSGECGTFAAGADIAHRRPERRSCPGARSHPGHQHQLTLRRHHRRGTSRRLPLVGLHFVNPVPASDLVEIVVGARTPQAVVSSAQHWVSELGKTAITVTDSPGFASSRLGVAIALEAMRMLEEGVASAEDIDTAMTLGYQHPVGPLRTPASSASTSGWRSPNTSNASSGPGSRHWQSCATRSHAVTWVVRAARASTRGERWRGPGCSALIGTLLEDRRRLGQVSRWLNQDAVRVPRT
jgi:hypothetical protein